MIRIVALLLLASACATDPVDPDAVPEPVDETFATMPHDDAPPPPRWWPDIYRTCGDPVCSGWRASGLPTCPAWLHEGLSCPPRYVGLECDPIDACNTRLTCARTDPTAGPGGCPISLREAKKDIAYLSPAQTEAVARTVASLPLATWRYNTESDDAQPHLGFIIDDIAPSPAIRPDGGHVDLYGYTSMAIAAVQAQQVRIDALEAELAALKEELHRQAR